ncbi:hypothetical protein COM07_18005 [Bacillus toyonensis]|nr:hypothetical protein COM07_18005 [Bacillus toyonensis]
MKKFEVKMLDGNKIAIYQQEYLTISMTFIYRQLQGIQKKYNPIVLASKVENLKVFPCDQIYSCPKKYAERIINKLYRTVTSKYATLSKAQCNYYCEILKKENVKLIHSHFGPSALEILPVAKKLNIPLVVTFHGYDASSLLKNNIYVNQLRELFEYGEIITVSQKMKNDLMKYGAKESKIRVHYIGVPIQDFSFNEKKSIEDKKKKNEVINFLQVSNFVEKKGHKYTISAFKEFLEFYPNSQLILGGDGPLKKDMEELCKELKVENKVQFIGKVVKEEVVQLMQEADVFLHHSVTSRNGDQEGIPTVIMEAMASGVTVVSTYHAGIPELIKDGYSGYLAQEKDIHGYVKKLKEVVESNNQIRENALNHIDKNYNMNIQNEKLIRIYDEILSY